MFIIFISASYAWASGSKELSTQAPGEGILVTYSIAHPGTVAKWTIVYIFTHIDSGKEYRIGFSDRTSIDLLRLPEGDYSYTRTVFHKDGQLDTALTVEAAKQSYGLQNFSISSGSITPLPFVVYYYDTKAPDHETAREIPMPENTSGWTKYSNVIRTDSTWKTAFYSYNEEFEAAIFDKLKGLDGFENWDYISPINGMITEEYSSKIGIYCIDTESDSDAERLADELAIWCRAMLTEPVDRSPSDDMAPENLKDHILNIQNDSIEDDTPLILYLSGQIAADFKGRPHFLFSPSDMNSLQSSGLSLSEIISSLSSRNGDILIILRFRKNSLLTETSQTYSILDPNYISKLLSNKPENISVLIPDGFNLDTNEKLELYSVLAKQLPQNSPSAFYHKHFWMKTISGDYPDLIWY